jgi:hypothetical protein
MSKIFFKGQVPFRSVDNIRIFLLKRETFILFIFSMSKVSRRGKDKK